MFCSILYNSRLRPQAVLLDPGSDPIGASMRHLPQVKER